MQTTDGEEGSAAVEDVDGSATSVRKKRLTDRGTESNSEREKKARQHDEQESKKVRKRRSWYGAEAQKEPVMARLCQIRETLVSLTFPLFLAFVPKR